MLSRDEDGATDGSVDRRTESTTVRDHAIENERSSRRPRSSRRSREVDSRRDACERASVVQFSVISTPRPSRENTKRLRSSFDGLLLVDSTIRDRLRGVSYERERHESLTQRVPRPRPLSSVRITRARRRHSRDRMISRACVPAHSSRARARDARFHAHDARRAHRSTRIGRSRARDDAEDARGRASTSRARSVVHSLIAILANDFKPFALDDRAMASMWTSTAMSSTAMSASASSSSSSAAAAAVVVAPDVARRRDGDVEFTIALPPSYEFTKDAPSTCAFTRGSGRTELRGARAVARARASDASDAEVEARCVVYFCRHGDVCHVRRVTFEAAVGEEGVKTARARVDVAAPEGDGTFAAPSFERASEEREG